MHKLAVAVQLVLGLALFGAAWSKLSGAQDVMRDRLGVGAWLWITIALIELLAATGMFAGIRWPRVALAAAAGLVLLMIGATAAHLRAGDSLQQILPPLTFLLLTLSLCVLRLRQLGLSRQWAGASVRWQR